MSPRFLGEYLYRTYCVARASVPLMEEARRTASGRAARDPVSAALAPYLARHIEEEKHHAAWLLDDLVVLGVAKQSVLRRVPPESIASGVGAQYYWIRHYHPVALFGYMAVLESSVLRKRALDLLIDSSDAPRASFRTLIAHSQRDPGHVADLFSCLDALPLQPRHARVVLASARHTVQFMKQNAAELSEEPGSASTWLDLARHPS